MRTTVTLEPDVESLIRQAMKEPGLSLRAALNSALRAGMSWNKAARRHFVQKTFALGPEQHFRWDKALAAAGAIEDEELSRKLSLRK